MGIEAFAAKMQPAVAALTTQDVKDFKRGEVQNDVEGYVVVFNIASAEIHDPGIPNYGHNLKIRAVKARKAKFADGLPRSPFEPDSDFEYVTTLLCASLVSRSAGRLILHNAITNELICLFPDARED